MHRYSLWSDPVAVRWLYRAGREAGRAPPLLGPTRTEQPERCVGRMAPSGVGIEGSQLMPAGRPPRPPSQPGIVNNRDRTPGHSLGQGLRVRIG